MEIIVIPPKRGQQPPAYGPRVCPWTGHKLYFSLDTCLYYCQCGWSGTLPMAEIADGVKYEPSSHNRTAHRGNGTGQPEGS